MPSQSLLHEHLEQDAYMTLEVAKLGKLVSPTGKSADMELYFPYKEEWRLKY